MRDINDIVWVITKIRQEMKVVRNINALHWSLEFGGWKSPNVREKDQEVVKDHIIKAIKWMP